MAETRISTLSAVEAADRADPRRPVKFVVGDKNALTRWAGRYEDPALLYADDDVPANVLRITRADGTVEDVNLEEQP